MNVGLYQGAAAIDTLDKWQEVVSQNIAASSVPGFKASEMSVTGLNYGSIQDGISSAQPAVMPTSTTQTSFLPGSMSRTGNPTDVAVDKGFFVVQEANGQTRYTRNGQFNVSPNNQLITATGDAVQGVGGAIQLLPNGQPVTINSTGQVYQGHQAIGKLKVVNFDDTSMLTKVSGGFYASDKAEPKLATSSVVSQGYLEDSNVSPVNQMVELIQMSKSQEANQKMIATYNDRLGKAIQTFTR
jgi:flagellar basal body rod protein FlgG